MARIVAVQGTGGPARSENSLRLEWVPSMLDGLVLAGYAADGLDVAFVDLDTDAPEPSRTRTDPEVVRLVRRWWENAEFASAKPVPTDSDDPVALLDELHWSRFFAGIPGDELGRTSRSTVEYLAGDGTSLRGTELVSKALTSDVTVVIGFALGAVAAVRALSAKADPDVQLVTMSAPYGWEVSGTPVTTWTNLLDVGDTLSGPVPQPSLPAADVRTDLEPRLRAPRNTLASAEFGQALGRALGLTPTRSETSPHAAENHPPRNIETNP